MKLLLVWVIVILISLALWAGFIAFANWIISAR